MCLDIGNSTWSIRRTEHALGQGNLMLCSADRPPARAGDFGQIKKKFQKPSYKFFFVVSFFLRAAGAPVRLLPSARGLKRPKMALESTKNWQICPSNHKIFACGALAFTSGYFRSLQLTSDSVVKVNGFARRRRGNFLGFCSKTARFYNRNPCDLRWKCNRFLPGN